jgi:iron(III) transport system substrate-binding protein
MVFTSFLLVFAASAFGLETNPDIIQDAKKEGSVTIYHSFPAERFQPIFDDFKEKYDVKVDAVIGDVEHKLEIEQRAGRSPADLMLVGSAHVWALHYIEKGWVAKYDSPAFKYYPENAKIEDYALNLAPSVAIVMYNTDFIPEGSLKSYHDIINPKYKGKIAIADAHKSSMAYEGFFAKYWAEDIGPKWWKSIADLNPLILSGQGAIQNAVISGEAWISVDVALHRYVSVSKKGAPVSPLLARGNVLRSNMCGVFKTAPHPNAARLLFDYLASPDAQEIVQKSYIISARKDMPTSQKLPGLDVETMLYQTIEDAKKHPTSEMFPIYDEILKK